MGLKESEQEMLWFMENVTRLRKQYGLSKREMARRLHIGVESLNKIERGQLPPRMMVEVVFHIQDHFHISPGSLFLPPPKQMNTQSDASQ